MMVKSNIGQVRNFFQNLKKGLPAAVNAAIESDGLFTLMKQSAREALASRWASEPDSARRALYERFTEEFIAGMQREITHAGVQFVGTIPEDFFASPSLEGAAALNLGARTPTGRIQKDFRTYGGFDDQSIPSGSVLDNDENLAQVRALLVEWVRTEKHLSNREISEMASPEEIANDLAFILGINETSAPNKITASRQAAAERLMPHIQDFIDRASRGEVEGIDASIVTQTIHPEMIEDWMKVVLQVWKANVPMYLNDNIKIELEKLLGRIKT